MRAALARVGLIAVLAWATFAHADSSPEAEKLFRDGRALLAQGKLAEACDAFTASAHIEPSVGTLLNLGDCREKLGQIATAWGAFAEAGRLAHKNNDKRRAEAERRAIALEPKLSYLTIQIAADAKLDGLVVTRNSSAVDSAVWNMAVPVDPGTYTIAATAKGYKPFQSDVRVGATSDRKALTVPKLEREPDVSATSTPATTAKIEPTAARLPPARAGDREVAPSSPPPTFTRTRFIGVVSGGAGVVALGASVVLVLQAKSLENDARKVCPAGQPCHDQTASAKSDQAVSKANLATIVGGVGIAAVGAGVALWFVGRPQEGPTPVSTIVPTASATSVGVAWSGSF